jgi:hypothetical protein
MNDVLAEIFHDQTHPSIFTESFVDGDVLRYFGADYRKVQTIMIEGENVLVSLEEVYDLSQERVSLLRPLTFGDIVRVGTKYFTFSVKGCTEVEAKEVISNA